MHYNCYPPIVHHHGYTVPRRGAQVFIGRYLARARTDPTFRPDAELTQTGVALRTHSADLGLGLKGLVDFEAGLCGRRVYSAEDFDGGEGCDAEGSENTKPKKSAGPWHIYFDGTGDDAETPAANDNEGDWMDKEAFERMQDEEIGGAEEGTEGMREGQDIPIRQAATTNGSSHDISEKEKKRLDKEQRKALKKARRKEERRALARQAEQEADE